MMKCYPIACDLQTTRAQKVYALFAPQFTSRHRLVSPRASIRTHVHAFVFIQGNVCVFHVSPVDASAVWVRAFAHAPPQTPL
jgi:hypothetical protein